MSKPTPEEVEAGLRHKDWRVRVQWAKRADWGPPTPEQVERGLQDENPWVRSAWVERTDWGPPTPEQIKRGLADSTRLQWLKRKDWTLTYTQAKDLLAKSPSWVQAEVLKRTDWGSPDEDVCMIVIRSGAPYLHEALLARGDWWPSEEIIINMMQHHDVKIARLWQMWYVRQQSDELLQLDCPSG